jgi:glycosyltransferase involved in cell wall biosynthesis
LIPKPCGYCLIMPDFTSIPVIHLMRKAQAGYHSFERLFGDVRRALPAEARVRVVRSWCHSNGFFKRLLNLVQVLPLRGAVIHITGDVHYLALGLAGRRVVLTIHDLAPLYPKEGMARRVFRCLWYTLPMRLAAVTTTISEAVRQEMVRELGVDADRIRVIPNCVSPAFAPSPRPWPAPPQRPVVLMVGTRPHKNLDRMLQALRGLDVEARIIGELLPGQRQELARHGVPFSELGRLPDAAMPVAYRDADLLAFASTYEGFGLPILEAQATGRPVLTSTIPACREAAGEGALCVDPRDITALRAALFRLINDPGLRAELVAKGFANVAKYRAGAVAEMYAEVYLSALESD